MVMSRDKSLIALRRTDIARRWTLAYRKSLGRGGPVVEVGDHLKTAIFYGGVVNIYKNGEDMVNYSR